MPRIDRNHRSIFRYLAEKNDIFGAIGYVFSIQHALHWYNVGFSEGVPRYSEDLRQQFLGGFQPVVDMGKDFINTFKSYKSNYHLGEDLAQPFRGVGNFLKGVTTLVLVPLIFLIRLFSALLYRGENIKNSVEALSWLVSSVSNIIRGLTQIVTTPLAWLFKVPLRLGLTAFKGRPKLEESKGIKRMVDRLFQLDEKQDADETKSDEIDYWLGYKCTKADMQGRKLPEGLDVDKKVREGERCGFMGQPYSRYMSFKGFFQVREIVNRLPFQSRPFFDVERYNAKTLDKRIKIMQKLKSVINEPAKVDAVLKKYNIHRGNTYAMLIMGLHKKPGSTFSIIPRDVVRIIARDVKQRSF